MSCIITYKGNKYTQEQFKEYISSNKNEFSHIIASNKNVIDSFKRKMESIDYVFSQSPELASIGSKAQYLQYLSTIFKTSKVKDIVYHGTNANLEQGFNRNKRIEGSGSPIMRGDIYASLQPETTLQYIKGINAPIDKIWSNLHFELKRLIDIDKRNLPLSEEIINKKITSGKWRGKTIEDLKNEYNFNGNVVDFLKTIYDFNLGESFNQYKLRKLEEFKEIWNSKTFKKAPYSLLLNIKNPLIHKNQDTDYSEFIEKAEINGNDGLLMLDNNDAFRSDVAVVFDDSQSHILGSKQDIEGFKEFVTQPTAQSVKSGVSELFESNSDLSKIGTQEQYSRYLETIFPDSKVKDIVYHGGSKTFEKFVIDSENRASGTSQVKKGIYLTRSKKVAEDYKQSREGITNGALSIILDRIEKSLGLKEYEIFGNKEDGYTNEEDVYKKPSEVISKLEKLYGKLTKDNLYYFSEEGLSDYSYMNQLKDFKNLNIGSLIDAMRTDNIEKIKSIISEYAATNKDTSKLYSVIVNLKNPTIISNKEVVPMYKSLIGKESLINKAESVIVENVDDSVRGNMREPSDTIIVFDPAQTHILGSKQDIEGFKEFADNSGKSNLFKDGKLTIGKHTITEKEFNAMTKDEQNNLRECL